MFSVIPLARSVYDSLNKTLRGKDEVLETLKAFDLSNEDIEEIMNLLRTDFDKGLSADEHERAESPIKMLPTYVRAIPDGTESGDFLALDLGGTNFRVLLISIQPGGEVKMESDIYPLDQALMTSDAQTLFDYIAGCIALFVKKNQLKDKSLPLGFTFSFPVKQLSLTSGLLIRWTKGFSATGVENEDVIKLLQEALVRNGVSSTVDVVALVNDTTGTMMSCALSNPNVSAGLILGTGTNACYMESLDNVPKWDGDQNEPRQVIINTEWGAFGDNGSWNHLRTKYDEQVDRESINPGMQLFEKMISGMYLGELARLVCMDLVAKKLLFKGQVSEKFKTKNSFFTKFVSDIESHERYKIDEVLNEMKLNASESDIEILQQVCAAVSKRAARLAAGGLATIVKKTNRHTTTIAVDGSLFKKHPRFKHYMEETLHEILPQANITLMLSEDGSGKGAALIAAVASKTNKA
ncbi:hexokinase-2-like [Orbicella faveolata]|uniref:hexokinase-2-like n=1 Tax=Orbicella faveolata TaxID=48498 RepID=UPI0009E4EECB|nr:hexokinase-2-like [Orbicella faveolata]XP_020607642.1 hexokinase-2-like [Orbicella faveolata]XP_020607643.1 hexokinase-2-like [Orbicella faveolata]XP_020607644.1 hexokinase-2-like [Orbicella faveolata]